MENGPFLLEIISFSSSLSVFKENLRLLPMLVDVGRAVTQKLNIRINQASNCFFSQVVSL